MEFSKLFAAPGAGAVEEFGARATKWFIPHFCAAGYLILRLLGINSALKVHFADVINALSQGTVKIFHDIFFTDIFDHAQLGEYAANSGVHPSLANPAEPED
jgi:hypothetical protein